MKSVYLSLLFLYLALTQVAHAVPSFARQTGQSCVACHAGGQFPELTPYGRLFKLMAYTSGVQIANPLSVMVVADKTKTANNSDGQGGVLSAKDKKIVADFASLFVAGKITENIGGFAQFTDKLQTGHMQSDNFDMRYADRVVDPKRDLIWGLTLNNNPSVQDVWNTTPAWNYPYISTSTGSFPGTPNSTLLEQQLQVAGTGAYVYLNQSWYAELTAYQTANNSFRFLSTGSKTGDPTNSLQYLSGLNPYVRLAYTHDWGMQNMMVGVIGMNGKRVNLDGSNMPLYSSITQSRDIGVDAQYQYLLEPHTVTVQMRYIKENINDQQQTSYTDGPARLNSFRAKSSYVYRSKYGASLAYASISGTPDSNAYSSSANNLPNTKMWTPEVFWLPKQNMRIGLQFNRFTQYNGTSINYDGAGRNASDNNTTFVYLWMAF